MSADATDQEGLNLVEPVHNSFQTGDLTAGQIVAADAIDGLTAPNSSFQLTFTRPVRLATVLSRFAINPPVDVTISGDDPTDMASTVFTMVPQSGLDSDADYTISFKDGGTDSSGASLKHVDELKIHTMIGPEVIRFRPQDGSRTQDTNQPVSVRFSVPMDKAATAAAFTVTADGRAVAGSKYWAEGDTVLVLTPRSSFKVGAKVVAKVSTAARSTGGLHIDKAMTATFTVYKPTSSAVGGGGVATKTSPWYPSEVYYFNLMNCTRVGKWVNNSGQCSTVTRHTLPAQNRPSPQLRDLEQGVPSVCQVHGRPEDPRPLRLSQPAMAALQLGQALRSVVGREHRLAQHVRPRRHDRRRALLPERVLVPLRALLQHHESVLPPGRGWRLGDQGDRPSLDRLLRMMSNYG